MDEEWRADHERWFAPYLEGRGNKTRRRMCPAYNAGLIGPGDRKSIQPMAPRWKRPCGAKWTNWSVVTERGRSSTTRALPKKGKASVGVAPQYAAALG